MQLHPFQNDAVDHALLSKRKYTAVVSPTGTGKSYMILACREGFPNSWIITPRLEIIAGFLKKLGYTEAHNYSEQQLIETSLSERITTPIRLRNMLLAGMRDEYGNSIRIDRLLIDELHHHNAETYQLIDACTDVPAIGFTATYFRGTPKGSKQLRDTWGAPFQAITYKKAAEQGYIQLPTYSTVPLVDDDCVEIQNGEFVIDSLESTTLSRLDDAVKLFHSLHGEDGQIERIPTMVSLPSRRLVAAFLHTLNSAGFDAVAITQETSQRDRQEAFSRCLSCRSILLQINVVSEGVDLPIKRLIDMRPWISPVGWLQQIGRIMRPGGIQPEYICVAEGTPIATKRGWVPVEFIKKSDKVWDGLEYVTHSGVVCNGIRDVSTVSGISMTSNHLILTTEGWVESWHVRESMQSQYLNRTELDCVNASIMQLPGVTYHPLAGMNITERGEFRCATNGEQTKVNFLNTFGRCPVQPIQRFKSTEFKMIVDMNRAMLDSQHGQNNRKTQENQLNRESQLNRLLYEIEFFNSNLKDIQLTQSQHSAKSVSLSPSKSSRKVYDILDCGPRNRFQAGPLILHNCTNRNLMRHAYLLEGLVPLSRIVEAQDGFPISSRAGMRAIGLESIGRFKPVFVRTQSGVQCTLYNLTCNEQTKIVQYCVLLHPAIPNPLIARKQNEKGDDDSITWGKWQKIEEIPTDFSGFQSAKPNDLSTNQLKWWKKSARIHGIDDLQPVTSKNFQILPVLSDTHTRLP